MQALIYVLVAAAAAYLLTRFVFPLPAVRLLLRLVRRACGLSAHSIEVDGRVWHYLEGGAPDGEVLLLLHGFGGDKDNWPIYARYFRKRYRIVIPDLPGFGDNWRDDDADYGIPAQTRRLHAFVNTLTLGRMHLVGNSMGGYLALVYTLEHPDDVRTLTLLNNAGVRGADKSELEVRAERGESPLVIASAAEFDDLLKFLVYRPLPVPAFVKTFFTRRALERREFLDRLFWGLFDEIRDAPLNDRLADIGAPTLIVWGRHDRLIDVSSVAAMTAKIPHSDSVIFDDVGHIPMLEKPAATARAQLAHMRRHGTE